MMPYYTPTASSIPVLHHLLAIVGLLTAGLAIALPIYLFIDGATKRASAKGETFGTALLSIMTKARSQSGGYLTHLGMGIILVGLIGSTMYVKTYEKAIPQTPGSSIEAGAYTFAFAGITETTEENGDKTTTALLNVLRDGKPAGTVTPHMVLPKQNEDGGGQTQKVSLIQQPLKDIFVSFSGIDAQGNANFTVKYFPMQWWVWLGFAATIIGSGLASWPKRKLQAA